VLALDGRVAGATLAAPIERQEAGRCAGQAGGHPDLVRIDGEVHQRPRLEAEDRRLRITVVSVLVLGVTDMLACHRFLQLTRGYRQAIQEQGQVQLVVGQRLFDRRQVSRTACRGSPLILVGSDDTGDHRLVDDARVRAASRSISSSISRPAL
jgi:hypothetical protein